MAKLSFPVPALRDAVVSLRPWRESDVPAKLMAFGDPVVQRFSWSRTAPYTEADAGAYFVEQQQARLAARRCTSRWWNPLTTMLCWEAARSMTLISSNPALRWATGWRRRLAAVV